MASIELSATNVFKFFSLMTPFLLAFFLILTSVLNSDIKALIYLLGTSLASVLNVLFMNLIKSKRAPDASPFCNIFSFPFTNTSNAEERYDTPSMTAMFISFTIAYICLPMGYNPPNTLNIPLVCVLVLLLIIDIVTQSMQKCNGFGASFLGTLVGFILGAGWYGLINTAGYPTLLYYSDFTGNGTICKRPRKEYMKCSVYKNGKILQSTNF